MHMNRSFALASSIALLLSLIAMDAAAQSRQRGVASTESFDPPGVTHILYGDLKIDESKVTGRKPESYQIVLYNISGTVVTRQSVSNNGRYSFNNLPGGEYNIVVENEGAEVARIYVRVTGFAKGEFRRDIELEWRDLSSPAGTKSPGVVSAAEHYDREPANQSLFDKSQDAIKKNDLKQAATLLHQLVVADPKDYQAWTALGLVHTIQDKKGDAEKAFRSALTEKPDYFQAQLNLGKLQIMQKNFDGAIETLTGAVETNPKSADANFLLGEAYLQIKKGSKAVGYLNEAVKLDPVGKAEAHLRLATLYRGAGLKDRAVAEYEQFLAKQPNHPDKAKIQQYIQENKPK
jgi:tetratricopeptide (TPR) repeat protein